MTDLASGGQSPIRNSRHRYRHGQDALASRVGTSYFYTQHHDTNSRKTEKSHALLMSTRAKSDLVSEAVLASTLRQGKFRDKEACRRCGAPSVRTFHFLFERVIAPVGGPWSKEKLWDKKFTQYTCRRCGQVYALPPAEASTPRNTPNDAATILRSEQVLLSR